MTLGLVHEEIRRSPEGSARSLSCVAGGKQWRRVVLQVGDASWSEEGEAKEGKGCLGGVLEKAVKECWRKRKGGCGGEGAGSCG